MRILMLGLALLALTCSAFAADVLTDTGTGVVSLTVEKFVSIDNAPDKSITISNNGTTGTATLVFPCVANTPASVTAAITAETNVTGCDFAVVNTPVAIVAPGGNASFVVNVTAAAQPFAGTDSCTVTATILAP